MGTVLGMDHLTEGPLTLVIIDDHQMVLDGLKAMLRPYREQVEVIGESSDAQRAVAVVAGLKPDVVLLDVRLRGASGLDLCIEILGACPGSKVVFLTVYDDEQYLFQGLRAGAAGYLTKQLVASALVEHLGRVMIGEIVVDPALAGRVALSASRLARGEFWSGAHLGLGQRESAVLELMVQGHSNRVIASRLMLGEETIKTHVSSIFRKLGVSDRTQAVAFALREGVFR